VKCFIDKAIIIEYLEGSVVASFTDRKHSNSKITSILTAFTNGGRINECSNNTEESLKMKITIGSLIVMHENSIVTQCKMLFLFMKLKWTL
jgi:hypothetical protein